MRSWTPFLPGISPKLFGSQPRSHRVRLEAQIEEIRRKSLSRLCELFGTWMPMELFTPTSTGANSRQRSYPMSVTFWAFLNQVLNPGSPCREMVRKIQAWYAQNGKSMPQSGNGAYCQARKRLPLEVLQKTQYTLAEKLTVPMRESGCWNGHRIYVVDGTGVSMPDTPSNRHAYPQPSEQKPGCGFPVLKMVGVFCLQTGALLRWVQGQLEEHECRLLMKLIKFFEPGDIVLADRGFCGYGQLATLKKRGVHSVMRLHQRRKVDWRKGRRLGRRDRLVQFNRPNYSSPLFERKDWKQLPEHLNIRLVEILVVVPGFRTQRMTLMTTLLNPAQYSSLDLGRLYFRRWSVEVFYRDIKQTMSMEILRCKSPEMIEKELIMHAIAYNLVRALMRDIGESYQVAIEQLSFKGTLDALRQWQPLREYERRRVSSHRYIRLLYETIVSDRIILRPGRSEPRAVKRRPKNYRLLTKPRSEMVVEPHRRRGAKSTKRSLN